MTPTAEENFSKPAYRNIIQIRLKTVSALPSTVMRRTGTPVEMSRHGLGAIAAVAVGMLGALLGAVALVAHPVVVLGAVITVLLVREARHHGTGPAAVVRSIPK